MCGKLIEADDLAYVASSDDITPSIASRFTQIQLMCCSRKCAETHIKLAIETHEHRIAALEEEKRQHEYALKRLQEYLAEPMSLREAQEELTKKV